MKSLEEIKQNIDRQFSGSYERNRRCLDDIEFAVVEGAQWKGSLQGSSENTSLSEQFKNKPKPEVNKIFGSINRLLGQKQRLEMNAKIISNSDEATDEDAELLQGRWRNDFQSSDGVMAIDNADFESFFGGFGAYKVVAKYEDEENPDKDKQYLCIEPIYSAASSVVFGPSLRKDKADASWSVNIIRTNRRDIEEEYGELVTSINAQIDWFDWNTDDTKDIYLAHYYEVITKNITEYDFDDYRITTGDGIKDEFGNNISREDLNLLLDTREYETIRKKIKYVEYALISGDKILTKPQRTPFKRQPITPQYGYHCVINGIEYYCGEVRKRRDPQMFQNTFYSSLVEIMAAPQVEKLEYTPEQIAKHASQRSQANIDSQTFLMSDPILDSNNNPVHFGPIGKMTPPQIGTGLQAAGQILETSLQQMAGTGQSTVPSNASSDAIRQVNERQDDTFQPLIQNSMIANKAACETWIDAAQKIYFTNPRKLRVVAQDGSHSQVETLSYDTDSNNNYGPFKNSARGRYSVQVKAGESYKTKKEAELETTLKMLNYADTSTEQGQMLLNTAILATTGEGGEMVRKIARFKMIDMLLGLGIDPEPKTDEEKQYVSSKEQQMQEASQNPQPDAMMLAAQAEMVKGQADMLEQQNKQAEIQLKAGKLQQDGYKVALSEQKQAADITNTNADTVKKISEAEKISGEAFSNQINDFKSIQPQ